MILGAIVIATLALLEVFAITFEIPVEFIYPIAILILLVAVALLYRTHAKAEAALKEKLGMEIAELRKELHGKSSSEKNTEIN